MEHNYLQSITNQFLYYKQLGEQTFAQLSDEQICWQYNDDSNSIAIIVQHLAGNMLSRFTDFLTTDGEKTWRNRDTEFEHNLSSKAAVIECWNKGWSCLFNTLAQLSAADLQKEIFIRNQGHTVLEAINRQLAHYSYHIGQIVFIEKMLCNQHWKSLSIPKGNSETYNAEKIAKEKNTEHFTNQYLHTKK